MPLISPTFTTLVVKFSKMSIAFKRNLALKKGELHTACVKPMLRGKLWSHVFLISAIINTGTCCNQSTHVWRLSTTKNTGSTVQGKFHTRFWKSVKLKTFHFWWENVFLKQAPLVRTCKKPSFFLNSCVWTLNRMQYVAQMFQFYKLIPLVA